MIENNDRRYLSAVFITFSGNCKNALTHYQTCFGGHLQFETFAGPLEGFPGMPVVNGSLVANRILIHGSDLVQNEGRMVGNHVAIFLACKDPAERKMLIEKLAADKQHMIRHSRNQKLVEITDAFQVRWILGLE